MQQNDMNITKDDIETFIHNYEGEIDFTSILIDLMEIYKDTTKAEKYVLHTLIVLISAWFDIILFLVLI